MKTSLPGFWTWQAAMVLAAAFDAASLSQADGLSYTGALSAQASGYNRNGDNFNSADHEAFSGPVNTASASGDVGEASGRASASLRVTEPAAGEWIFEGEAVTEVRNFAPYFVDPFQPADAQAAANLELDLRLDAKFAYTIEYRLLGSLFMSGGSDFSQNFGAVRFGSGYPYPPVTTVAESGFLDPQGEPYRIFLNSTALAADEFGDGTWAKFRITLVELPDQGATVLLLCAGVAGVFAVRRAEKSRGLFENPEVHRVEGVDVTDA